MDWDSKMTLWEFPESLDCSVDLKLGGMAENCKEQRGASSSSASSSSLKRNRGQSNGGNAVLCLVDGCNSDLSACKEYHRRHKVCELHSKTPVVMVAGQEQRFCQQCSRFHLLGEFDEVKRSCRKRLDGHNRRRRKPPVETLNNGILFSNQYASRFTSYPPNFAIAGSDAAWSSAVKAEDDALYHIISPPPDAQFVDTAHQPPSHQLATSFRSNYKEGQQFFLNEGSSRMAVEPVSVCQPLLNTIQFSSEAECSSNTIQFSNGLSQVFDSDCALSLLSSSAQPMLSQMHYDVSHCESMFQVGYEDASDCASESHPFSWQL